MKVSKEQLKKIIQEELQELVSEEDLQQEFIGGLGKVFKTGAEKVGGLAKAGAEKAGQMASDVAKVYKAGEEEARQQKHQKLVTNLSDQLKTIISQLRGLGLSDNQIDAIAFNVQSR